jgi:hypothetical protein
MGEMINDLKVRATLNIFRLYPAWKQDGSSDCLAWIEANKAVLKEKTALVEAGEDPDQDQGWPDPSTWNAVTEPKKTNLEQAIDEAQPPEAIQADFEAHGMDPAALFKLHTELTSKIVGGFTVTDSERALQSRLTPHVPWLKKRMAVEVV